MSASTTIVSYRPKAWLTMVSGRRRPTHRYNVFIMSDMLTTSSSMYKERVEVDVDDGERERVEIGERRSIIRPVCKDVVAPITLSFASRQVV